MISIINKYCKYVLSLRWKLVAIIFILGLLARTIVFIGDHEEGDELIYMNLVQQLDMGQGYTLHKSALVEYGLVDREQYDRPLFFHPPGGIVLNLLFYKIFGIYGFPLVQMFSFALFFWSMMLLADSTGLLNTDYGMALIAALSGFSPIMAHVTTKFWLDGPLLAIVTLATATFTWAVVNDKAGWAFTSGVLLGYASLIKLTAFLVLPGCILLGWSLFKAHPRRQKKWRKQNSESFKYLRFVALMLVPAIVVQLPWEIWQWVICGSPFPSWAGKPSAALLASNSYVHYLTHDRPPWVYLTLTPRVLWTLVPAVLLYIVFVKKNPVRWQGGSLLVWIFSIILIHIGMGYFGYSNLLRYIILVTPAYILLFVLTFSAAVQQITKCESSDIRKWATVTMIAISVVAVCFEVANGALVVHTYRDAMIYPILGKFY